MNFGITNDSPTYSIYEFEWNEFGETWNNDLNELNHEFFKDDLDGSSQYTLKYYDY